ncbi:hypothetical protein BDZ89DRAFT_1077420 [Hymenopellis radicata]|nr:hypothetical protein BDZ89DRAFT_1077420 [Hymenopellis radicata]
MKLARVLDGVKGGNLQLMNAFIRSDKHMEVCIFYFSGEPRNLEIKAIKVFFDLQVDSELQHAMIFMANFLDRHTAECKFNFLGALHDAILNCPETGIPSRTVREAEVEPTGVLPEVHQVVGPTAVR